MRKNLVIFCLIVLISVFFIGCTSNQRAKNFGGTMTIDLPPGQKLVVATWKEDDLWYLYRPMRSGEAEETSILKEDSSFGMMKGTVIFKEHK